MLLRRPVILPYWALPASLALVLGILWLRRKRDDDNDSDEAVDRQSQGKLTLCNGSAGHINSNGAPAAKLAHSISMPAAAYTNNNSNNNSPTSPTSAKLGKSAPIDIQPNRITPVKLTNQQIDRDILKVPAAAAVADNDDIHSGDSPCALSDSGERRRRFSFGHQRRKRIVKEGNPVVIKATNPAKISPEHSFVEAKYEEATTIVRPQQTQQAPNVASAGVAIAPSNEIGPVASAEELPAKAIKSKSRGRRHAKAHPEQTAQKVDGPVQKQSKSKKPNKAHLKLSTPASSVGSSKDSGQGSASPLTSDGGNSSLKRAKINASTLTIVQDNGPLRHYDFLIVQDLIGTLLGRKGVFVKEIRRTTGTNVVIRKHPQTNVVRIASLEGSSVQIDAALRMVRKKFPLRRHPALSLQQVHVDDVGRLNHSSQSLQLDLIEGINNDVHVSAVVSGGHIFVQQPVHPSYPNLLVLQRCMMRSYHYTEAPEMPTSQHGRDAVCAAKFCEHWYRVQIGFEADTACVVKFLDYGGYATVQRSQLRQIRADFMTLPFQATECVMANIRPLRGEGAREWQRGALRALQTLTESRIVQAQVVGYTVDGLASVHLYSQISPSHVVFVNRELVARGLARWVEDGEPISGDTEDELDEVEWVEADSVQGNNAQQTHLTNSSAQHQHVAV